MFKQHIKEEEERCPHCNFIDEFNWLQKFQGKQNNIDIYQCAVCGYLKAIDS